MIAPSDMMDNRVAAIKAGLLEAGLGGKVLDSYVTILNELIDCTGSSDEL